jgi:hypothetical protein
MKTLSKLIITAAIVFSVSINLQAQNKITLSHQGIPAFFTNLSTALTSAANGDTLYLPGGTIQPSASDITINKSVHIVGTGHYPDSTAATGRTIITTLRYLTGSGGGSIQGCAITNLYIGYAANQNITGLSVTRCTIGLCRLGNDNISTIDNIYLTDNVFTGTLAVHSSYPNILILRNIINGGSGLSGLGLFIKNNIFYQIYSNALSGFASCNFENNIIISTNSNNLSIESQNCNYSNNLFIPNVSNWGTNTQQNSLLNQTLANTFENVTGSAFSYSHNYQLKSSSPGNNYGTDGTDVGIFGTTTPYKEGAVPFNPHIMFKSISTETTPQGMLNVTISVSAQDR